MAMTNAERQRAYRERQKAAGKKRDWAYKAKPKKIKLTAVDVAKERLQAYLDEKLKPEKGWDEDIWEFYGFLLEKAQGYKIGHSGYASTAYQKDRAEARRRNASAR